LGLCAHQSCSSPLAVPFPLADPKVVICHTCCSVKVLFRRPCYLLQSGNSSRQRRFSVDLLKWNLKRLLKLSTPQAYVLILGATNHILIAWITSPTEQPSSLFGTLPFAIDEADTSFLRALWSLSKIIYEVLAIHNVTKLSRSQGFSIPKAVRSRLQCPKIIVLIYEQCIRGSGLQPTKQFYTSSRTGPLAFTAAFRCFTAKNGLVDDGQCC